MKALIGTLIFLVAGPILGIDQIPDQVPASDCTPGVMEHVFIDERNSIYLICHGENHPDPTNINSESDIKNGID